MFLPKVGSLYSGYTCSVSSGEWTKVEPGTRPLVAGGNSLRPAFTALAHPTLGLVATYFYKSVYTRTAYFDLMHTVDGRAVAYDSNFMSGCRTKHCQVGGMRLASNDKRKHSLIDLLEALL